ncbi:hypothetical protein N9B94_03790 [Verrucomicrobia bacterium]|nr:hypothetical protein [Verrucomicrobiota bacterium]
MKKADAGDPVAQNSLGSAYQAGKGLNQDPDKAFDWYQKAAEQDLPLAQYNLGFCYYRGTGVKQDFQEALLWIGKAASQGFAIAQYAIAGFYYRGSGGLPVNYDEAFFWYQKSAGQGYPAAQYLLGLMFFHGHGVEQNYVRATAWFDLASRGGDKGALAAREKSTQFLDGEQSFSALQLAANFKKISEEEAKGPEPSLGLDRFPTSSGVLVTGSKKQEAINAPPPLRMGPADPDHLTIPVAPPTLATPASIEPVQPEAESPGFLSNLKKLFIAPKDSKPGTATLPPSTPPVTTIDPNGLPTMKVVPKAKIDLPPSLLKGQDLATLLAKAKTGDLDAQFQIGLIYSKGSQGVKQDYRTALQWLTTAADAGQVAAQRALGLLFLHGRGVSKNLTLSVQRFGQAALSGDTESQYLLGTIYEKGDDLESARWYRMAADKGHAPSQNALGQMNASGQGIDQNYVEAAKWLELASKQGGVGALTQLKNLHQFMSLEEMNEARRRAASFNVQDF